MLMASIVFASLSNVNALIVEFVELFFWSHRSNNEHGFDEPFWCCVPGFSSTEPNASFEHETDLAALAIMLLENKILNLLSGLWKWGIWSIVAI